MGKLYWVTNLRVIATILVVLIHCSGGVLAHYNDRPYEWWWIGNCITVLGRFAVPVFVMISGALLLGKKIELFPFLKKRFLRVWVPFTVWVIIYVLYHNLFERNPYSFSKAFVDYLTMGGGLYGHFWFIYMILGLYLITPFVNHFLLRATKQESYFLLFLCFVSCSIFPFIKKFFGVDIRLDLQNVGGYLGYFVAGFILKNAQFSFNKWFYITCILILYFLAIYGNYWLTSPKGKFDDYFSSYLSPNIILMSVCIFMLFKEYLNIEFIPSIINRLDAASFGIYLCHFLIITIISHEFHINWAWYHPLIGIFTQAGITLTIAYLLIWGISKLPKGYWVTG